MPAGIWLIDNSESQAFQGLGFDHAQHRQAGQGGGHAGPRCAAPAGGGDDLTLDPLRLGRLGEGVHALRRPVRGDHLLDIADVKHIEHLGGLDHGAPVGLLLAP